MYFLGEQAMRDADSETNFVLELWDTIKEALPANKRQEVADRFVSIFIDHGWDLEELGLQGHDRSLDEALREHLERNDSDEDLDEEYSYDD